MDIAIVTGAETPLGSQIIERLIRQGCRVHGIGNNLSKLNFADPNFIAHAIDVSDIEAVASTTGAILEKEKALHILIHAIDVTPGGSFEKLPVGNLEAILKIGLLGPVMLTRLALPNLLRYRGQLINIIPANKSGHKPSAVNALIEGGLREMNAALFDQARDAGLRVTNLILRQNTEFPDGTASDAILKQSRIDPEQVARTVETLLNENDPNVPAEIVLYPRLSAEAKQSLPQSTLPVDPYNAIVLPPAQYCPPEEPAIPTKQKDRIERVIPYSDEEMEDKIAAAIEDFDSNPQRYESEWQDRSREPRGKGRRGRGPRSQDMREPRNDTAQQSKSNQSNPKSTDERSSDAQNQDTNPNQSKSAKRRRGRRRGGRNRSRERESDGHSNQANPQQSNQHEHTASAPQPAKPEQAAVKASEKPKRKPKPKAEAAATDQAAKAAVKAPKAVKKTTATKKAVTTQATKKTAKKVAKKAVKKVAAKKAPAKKKSVRKTD